MKVLSSKATRKSISSLGNQNYASDHVYCVLNCDFLPESTLSTSKCVFSLGIPHFDAKPCQSHFLTMSKIMKTIENCVRHKCRGDFYLQILGNIS